MGETAHKCVGCGEKHPATLWYYRELGEMEQEREWLCGSRYNELSGFKQDRWRLEKPQ